MIYDEAMTCFDASSVYRDLKGTKMSAWIIFIYKKTGFNDFLCSKGPPSCNIGKVPLQKLHAENTSKSNRNRVQCGNSPNLMTFFSFFKKEIYLQNRRQRRFYMYNSPNAIRTHSVSLNTQWMLWLVPTNIDSITWFLGSLACDPAIQRKMIRMFVSIWRKYCHLT